MFASQCYWTKLKSERLTPVYDWHAAIAAHGSRRNVTAKWELLAGTGSLPREVAYLGQWGETNGLYRAKGTTLAGSTLIPNGFVFEERYVGPIQGNSLIHGMALRKRVEVEVTAIRPVCSKASLLPSPPPRTIVV